MVMKIPQISIVIACYNSPYVVRMLQQLQEQSFMDWECLCIDNSPNNDMIDLLKPYERNDERIIVRRAERISSSASARNLGVELARGLFVWIVDSDDEFVFDEGCSLSNLVSLLKDADSDISFIPCHVSRDGIKCASYIENVKGSIFSGKKYLFDDLTNVREALSCMPLTPWSKIFKREFLKNNPSVRFQDIPFCNDNLFSLLAYNFCSTIAFLQCNDVYQQNKINGSTSSIRNKSNNIQAFKALLEGIFSIPFRSKQFQDAVCKGRVGAVESMLNKIRAYRNCGMNDMLEELNDLYSLMMNHSEYISKRSKWFSSLLNAPKQNEDLQLMKRPVLQDKFSFSDGTMQGDDDRKYDAVFVLGNGSMYKDLELLLAVKSMRKFCPFVDRIFVVGDKPRCNLSNMDCTHVPCKDPYDDSKDANMMFKIIHIINTVPDLTENFLLCSDDQLVTQPCVWDDFIPKYVQRVTSDDIEEMKRQCGRDGWMRRLVRTLESFNNKRQKAWFYEPHIWSPINKKSFKAMIHNMGGLKNAGVIKSQYYNSIDNLEHEKVHDHKFFASSSMDWSKEFEHPPKFLAYNDKAFAFEEFRTHLAMLVK